MYAGPLPFLSFLAIDLADFCFSGLTVFLFGAPPLPPLDFCRFAPAVGLDEAARFLPGIG